MAMKKPIKKAAPKKAVKKTGGSADSMERNNQAAFNRLYRSMHGSGGEIGEADAVAMLRKTAREALKRGMPITNEARYYVENPKTVNSRSPEQMGSYFATKKSAPFAAGKVAKERGQRIKKAAPKKVAPRRFNSGR
jgi:hypothetical protein